MPSASPCVTKNDANGGYFVDPASHAAGVYWGVSNVMGMRIRLKAGFDISGYSKANQAILTAMKKYGMILADNGSYFYFQGAPDPRWNDADLINLDSIQSSNFEVVQMDPAYPGYDSVTAPSGQPPTINLFTATPSQVTAGMPVTLAWNTSNDSYDIIDQLGGVRGGSVTITPSAIATYTLSATNAYGRSTAQVTVKVTGAAPPITWESSRRHYLWHGVERCAVERHRAGCRKVRLQPGSGDHSSCRRTDADSDLHPHRYRRLQGGHRAVATYRQSSHAHTDLGYTGRHNLRHGSERRATQRHRLCSRNLCL